MEQALESHAYRDWPEVDSGDAVLAESAKSNPHAFGELYERYYARVHRYVNHRVRSASDAEDITSLVFMKALESLHSYKAGPGGFAPWLFRITRNAVVDYYRRQRHQSSLDHIDHWDSGENPEADALGNERAQELRTLVDHLSPDQREVVLLRYAADLTYPEIAATMKKKEPAVRMLLHRGLRKLKAVIDDERL